MTTREEIDAYLKSAAWRQALALYEETTADYVTVDVLARDILREWSTLDAIQRAEIAKDERAIQPIRPS